MIVDGGELVITFQLLPFNGQFSIKKMKVAVVKYNAGNIRSVDYALKRLGVEAVITADEAVLRAADKVIFPGVGEAETTMDFLRAGGMDRLIKELRQPGIGLFGLGIAVDVPPLWKRGMWIAWVFLILM